MTEVLIPPLDEEALVLNVSSRMRLISARLKPRAKDEIHGAQPEPGWRIRRLEVLYRTDCRPPPVRDMVQFLVHSWTQVLAVRWPGGCR
jgi:hypothetical protein